MAEVKHTLRVEGGANSHFFDGCLLDQNGKCLAFVGLDHPLTPVIAAAPDLFEALTEARLTLSLTRTNIMVEMKKSEDAAYRWEGVPELFEKRIAQCDAALSKATTQQEGR